MTAADFRRIALSLEGVEEYSHAGLPAFRVGGRKFASLASQAEGYGNLMLTLGQQAAFALFQTHRRQPISSQDVFSYDVSADGQKFLIITKMDEGNAVPLSVHLNWASELEK